MNLKYRNFLLLFGLAIMIITIYRVYSSKHSSENVQFVDGQGNIVLNKNQMQARSGNSQGPLKTDTKQTGNKQNSVPAKAADTLPPQQNQPLDYHESIPVILRDCGQLCNTSRHGLPGPYFDHIKAPIDCTALFKNDYIDRGHGLKVAPRNIPKELLNDYTMNGRVRVSNYYFNQQYLGKKAETSLWSKEMIDLWVARAKNATLQGTYYAGETNALRDGLRHASLIKDGRVLVIGSENPWVEACALEAGAREVVTLEYGRITSTHPQVKTLVPYEFRMMYLNGTLGTFDAIVTFSSVEHSGLGRYGDGLNPWGDIIAIARAWCVTKPKGSLTIGVMYNFNNDMLQFNAHRYYGKIRYPYLTTNWKQVYKGRGIQKVHVFEKDDI
ncbi:uncharacterized protein LOC134706757 [Mytilus trossulus]|uniref:uncharacterized protein LOC134706757 n=1 Tax=Mytilus trossulus TaxID=6551 RepID=UPI003007BB2E